MLGSVVGSVEGGVGSVEGGVGSVEGGVGSVEGGVGSVSLQLTVAVIVATPFPTAVTVPLLTVATLLLLDFHVIDVMVIPSGGVFTDKFPVLVVVLPKERERVV